jgi:hypothetical protein
VRNLQRSDTPRRLACALALLSFCLTGRRAHAQAIPPISATAVDLSPQFAQFGAPASLDATAIDAAFAAVRPALADMTVIIVPSWLSGPLLALRQARLSDFFLAIETRLTETGARVVVADVNTAAGVAINGARVRQAIAASARPVCLVTHSKGGLDALEALVRSDAETLAKVRCWVALQAPFYGSPLADTAPVVGSVGAFLLTLASGDGKSLADLRTDRRAAYMAEWQAGIETVVTRVRPLCVASYFDGSDPRFPHPPQLRATRAWMEQRGQRNDSLVPTDSSVLPGCRYVILSNIDHTDTISTRLMDPSPLDPGLLIRALLALALAP